MILLDTHIWRWWISADAKLDEQHSDRGDQIIIATARIHGCPLLTADEKILAYPHVSLARYAGPRGQEQEL